MHHLQFVIFFGKLFKPEEKRRERLKERAWPTEYLLTLARYRFEDPMSANFANRDRTESYVKF